MAKFEKVVEALESSPTWTRQPSWIWKEDPTPTPDWARPHYWNGDTYTRSVSVVVVGRKVMLWVVCAPWAETRYVDCTNKRALEVIENPASAF